MTETATLVAAHLPQFCPVTHHYQCSDGKWLLVTVARMDTIETLSEFLGVRIPILKAQLPEGVDVFLSNEIAEVVDADGDPTNGMTALATFNVETHEQALVMLGYQPIGGAHDPA